MKTPLARMRGAFVLIFALPMLGAAPGLAADSLELVSRVDPSQYSDTAAGGHPLGDSFVPLSSSLSADGRYVAFTSSATHLAPGQKDVNGGQADDGNGGDVFLEDLATGATTLVSHSLSSSTTTGNAGSTQAVLSADGRWVAFVSAATDLAPGQQGNTGGHRDFDLLLFDRVSGATTLVAADSGFHEGIFLSLALSADGRYLAFTGVGTRIIPGQQGEADTNAFVYDRVGGALRLISHPAGSPTTGAGAERTLGISADGRFILFSSFSDLLPGSSPSERVFLYDRAADSLILIPGTSATISADGKYVAFSPGLSAPLSLYSRETGVTIPVVRAADRIQERTPAGLPAYSLSADGRFIAFLLLQPTPTATLQPTPAIFDRLSQTTTTVSRAAGASSTFASAESAVISGDGRFVAFASADREQVPGQIDPDRSSAENLDVFLFDRAAGKTTLVSHAATSPVTAGDGASSTPAISANGARLVFTSQATRLVDGLADLNVAPDLFAYSVAARSLDAVTRRAPALPSLSPGAGGHIRALSADGRYAAFESDSANIVAGQADINGQTDVFLYDAVTKTTVLVSHVPASAATAPLGTSFSSSISADGRYVAFLSSARNLVPGANPSGQTSVFLYDRVTGAVTFVARGGDRFQSSDLYLLLGPKISADGRWIAFTSSATNLVPGQQDPNLGSGPNYDVFLWDRVTSASTLVSHAASGLQVAANGDSDGPALSADGRFVAYRSQAGDLVPGQADRGSNAVLFDRATGATVLVSRTPESAVGSGNAETAPALSADGRFLLFSSPTAGLDPNGPPSSSFFVSVLYLYDNAAKTYRQIGTDDIHPRRIALSADGRFAAFLSRSGLVPGVNSGDFDQLYLYDRVTGALTLATHQSQNGFPSHGYADEPVLSADGRYLAFVSDGQDLVAGQIQAPGRGRFELSAYLYDRVADKTLLLSRWQGSAVTAAGGADNPLLSASGQRIAFDSAIDLLYGDFNRRTDPYLLSLGVSTPGGPVSLPPCVLFDTRRPANGPALRSNAARVVKATGACGVPATAKRVTAKVTVFQGTGQGNVRFYPGDLAAPSAGILRFSRGQSRSATFDLPVAPNGAGTLTLLPFVGGNGTVGVSVEIDGYTP